jgi:DnaJ-class molecular chaperone
MKNPYEVLGLAPNTPLDEVKKAYRKLAMQHHPDKGGNAEKFKEISQAYDDIINPKPQEPQGFPGGFPFNHPPPPPQIKRGNVGHTVFISLDEAYFGCSKKFKVPVKKVCRNCRQVCQMCGGAGAMQMFIMTQVCPMCQGGGGKSNGCDSCKQRGYTLDNVNINFNIPPNVNHGATMVAQGLGEQAVGDTDIPGDFVLTIEIKDHPVFMRERNNLILLKKISFEESIRGTTVEVPHFTGTFTVDTKQWGVLDPRKDYMIKGKGMREGDLRIGFDIQYPKPEDVYLLTKVAAQ